MLSIRGCHLRLSPSRRDGLIERAPYGAFVIGLLQPQFVYNSLGGAPKR